MHELSVANRLVDLACETARDHGAERVTGLAVEVGTATHLRPDQLRFCVETVADGTAASGADVTVETVAPRGECDCGWAGRPADIEETVPVVPDLTCPDCGSRMRLTAGRECRLASIDVPDEDSSAPTDGEATEPA